MSFAVVDWRRQVHQLYDAVRHEPDPAKAHAQWVRRRDELLRSHSASPVPQTEREDFQGARVSSYDSDYRFIVPVAGCPPEVRRVQTGTDGEVVFARLGVVQLPEIGHLDVWWLTGYGGGLFIPIRDVDPESYPGGRYVVDTAKGADLGGDDNGLIIDLNFAYQPSCAYDPVWACPLAGAGNTVTAAVPVGEKYRRGTGSP